ncbi:MAG: TrkA family potassium uptake protein [Candidatus Marinimicrobia bacterium]|nr:TrkA family potassium uptake protein [Candidatus Neomarinimicrobiota bacterium]
MAKEKNFGIFGLGTFGLQVCNTLVAKGGKVIAIDKNFDKIEKVKNIAMQALHLDSTDEDAINNAPIEDIDVAIVGMGDSIESSILTTAILKKKGVPRIIARAISDIHERVLKQIGATEVLNLQIEEGKRLANSLMSPEIVDRIELGNQQVMVEMFVPETFVGKSLVELDLRKTLNINIVSVKRHDRSIDDDGSPVGEEIVIFPTADTKFQDGDRLIVAGLEAEIAKMKEY